MHIFFFFFSFFLQLLLATGTQTGPTQSGVDSGLCEMYIRQNPYHRNWNPVVRHMVLIKVLRDVQLEQTIRL